MDMFVFMNRIDLIPKKFTTNTRISGCDETILLPKLHFVL